MFSRGVLRLIILFLVLCCFSFASQVQFPQGSHGKDLAGASDEGEEDDDWSDEDQDRDSSGSEDEEEGTGRRRRGVLEFRSSGDDCARLKSLDEEG